MMALRREDVDLAAGVIRVGRGWDEEVGEVTPKSPGRGRCRYRGAPRPAVEYLMDGPTEAASSWA